MRVKISKSAMSFIKYLIWTGIAVVIQTAMDYLYNFNISIYYVPIIASILKAMATYVATQKDEAESECDQLK